jgi:hypothetical protein
MKITRWILASMFLGLLAAACSVPTASAESEAEAETPAEAVQASPDTPGIQNITTYYSDATKTVIVGHCIFQTCPPKGTACTGTKTGYFTIRDGACYL